MIRSSHGKRGGCNKEVVGMDRPIRFTQEMIDDYFTKGHWTEETTSHLWEKNQKLYPDKEALSLPRGD